MAAFHTPVSPSWKELAESPTFQKLVKKKKRFLIPAIVFFLVYYFLLPIFAGWAKSLMGWRVVGQITFGYLFALSQFAMVWVLCWIYVRKSSEFDQLAEQLVRDEHERSRKAEGVRA